MLDIIVTIENYDPSYVYTVNIYRKGSAIPIATMDVGLSAGKTVIFKNLPGGYDFDAEVIKYCGEGKTSIVRKQVYTAKDTTCQCPPGFVANSDNTRCVKTISIAPTIVGGPLSVGLGPNEVNYCREGIRVYAPGFNADGTGAVQYESGDAHLYWAALGDVNKGRLNIAGVWNMADASLPFDEWIGFSKKVIVATAGVYYIGIAGDNAARIRVNGQVIVQQDPNGGTENFNYWHCYPVFLNAGENFVELEGINTSSQGCFAAEIYNCGLAALQAVTPGTEASLNRIFQTGEVGTFNNQYQCGAGYALDLTGTPMCKKIEFTSCGG